MTRSSPVDPKTHIQVQTQSFDVGTEFDRLRDENGSVGAVVFFTGLVRDLADDPLQEMVLEHYPGMTERCLADIVEQARQRWPLLHVSLIHRVGALKPNDLIVYVGVSSAHREAAFAACEFIMDYLKKDAPFWKKERSESREHWVEQKDSDLQAAKRWDKPD
ncbi:molybdopterin synthase catalytic subunit MoaE [Motiliproteus coralliicola]|uniref:molybdopterin synthase catalytic subunit MoaE n=1 Tax=Motiliproteus coralliicola TaxID=2283196 RepID=UPI001FB3809C|nr:molybdopterin synthase catalytic subunit MoaE [Motiliproteus coralliicola]